MVGIRLQELNGPKIGCPFRLARISRSRNPGTNHEPGHAERMQFKQLIEDCVRAIQLLGISDDVPHRVP
jgi:hypothetical protein